jgi:hypothetical protein
MNRLALIFAPVMTLAAIVSAMEHSGRLDFDLTVGAVALWAFYVMTRTSAK